MLARFLLIGVALFTPLLGSEALSAAVPASGKLDVIWGAQGAAQALISLDQKELQALKQASSREADPASGAVVRWNGVLLQSVVERSLRDVPLENKALVDLLILKTATGAEAVIPRSLVQKFPVYLASAREGVALGGLTSVVPWSSRPRVKEEGLPLESYFLTGVTSVELANSRERFKPFFLQRRTDPSALRGEGLFLKNCVVCHSAAGKTVLSDMASEAKSRSLASGHPAVRGFKPLSERDQRALQNYFRSFRMEKAQGAATPDQVAKH